MKTVSVINRIGLILAACALIFALSACTGTARGGDASGTASGTASDTQASASGSSGSSGTSSGDSTASTDSGTVTEDEPEKEKPFEPDTTGSSVTPQKAPDDLDLGYRASVTDTDTWRYFISDSSYAGQDYQMVCRDDAAGNTEVLYGLVQPDDYMMNIGYVDHSFEGSGGRFLYFTVENGLTLHESLFCFDLETAHFNAVLSEPCSNMVVFYDAPADIEGLGWVLCGDYILPIDLSDASSYEGMARGIEDLGDMSAVSYSFFFSSGVDEYKYSILDALPNGVLKIQVVTFSPSAETPETRVTYNYDCVKQTIKKVG